MSDSRIFIPVDFVSSYDSTFDQGGAKTYFAVAPVAQIPTNLPLTPNLRRANKKTEVFQQILHTLRTAPERFFERNNGIKIAASEISIEKTKQRSGIWIDFGESIATGGVLNGGHTLAAIESARIEGVPLDKARVKVEILCGLDDLEISTTSVAVNTATPVDTRSKLNALGVFEPIKAYLDAQTESEQPPLRIAYYQNQEGIGRYPHCSVVHIYDLLTHIDRMRHDFTKPGKSSHPKGSTSQSVLKSESFQQRILSLLPLLTDALWIEKNLLQLVHKHLEPSSLKGFSNLAGVKSKGIVALMDGSYFGFTVPVSFSLPVVAAYRVFIAPEAPCTSWSIPFDQFAPVLLPELWKWYRDELKKEKAKGNESFTSIIRHPAIWSDLCLIAQDVQRQLLKEHKQKAPFRPTHTLINHDSGSTTLVTVVPASEPDWNTVYTASDWEISESSIEYHPKLGMISRGVQLVNTELSSST
jgi:hypothetical protein